MEVEVREAKGKKIEVLLDGEVYCKCYWKDLAVSGIAVAVEESQTVCTQQLSFLETEVFLPRAKRRALFLLEKKEYTEKELRKKLQADGYPKITVEAVTEYVKELHYVNDRSFAERYALYLLPRYSERELMQRMLAKGFDKDLVKDAVETAKETYRYEHEHSEEEERPELTAIRTFLRKKGYRQECCDEDKKRKLLAALYRKGFSFSDIKEVMGALDTAEELYD